MDDGNRGGARVWLAVAVIAAACALGAAALRGGPAGGDARGRAGGGEPGRAARRAPLQAPAGGPAAPGPEAGGARAAAPEAPPSADLVVTARDATTGERVRDFLVERGGVQDLAASAPAIVARSDPEAGEAHLLRGADPRPLRVRARRYSVWRGMEPEPPGRRVVASLQRATTLHGVVRDASGAPVPGARVELQSFGEGVAGLARDAEPVPYAGSTLRIAGDDGSYEFSGLEPGVWRTRVPWPGETSVSTKQVLRPGQWQVADHWLGARTRIEARVEGAGGPDAPPARVLVVVRRTRDATASPAATGEDSWGALAASGYTDDTGVATLGPLPAGAYTVSVQSESGEASPQEIDVETSSPPSVTIVFDLGSTDGG